MTLGQEFHAWSLTLGKDLDRMANVADQFYAMNLGGTAIGTGINTDCYVHLADISSWILVRRYHLT